MFDINTLIILLCNCTVYSLIYWKRHRDEANERIRNRQHDEMWQAHQRRKGANGKELLEA